MQQWEFRVVSFPQGQYTAMLNQYGADGWELVQVVPAPGGGDQVVAYLKRPLP